MHVSFGGIHEGNLAELRLLNDTTFPVRYNDRFYQEVLTTLPEFTKYAYVHGQVVGAICCRVEEEEVEEEEEGEEDGGGEEQVVQISSLPALQQEEQQQQQEQQQEQQQGGGTSTPPPDESGNGHVFLPPRRTKRRRKLYIMTLGVQAAYRGQGIGSRLLTSVLDAAIRPPHCSNTSGSSSSSSVTSPYLEEIYLHVQTSNADAIHFYSKFGFVTREMIRNYYKRIEPPDCYILSRALGGGGGGGGEARKGKRKAPSAASSSLGELATAAAAAAAAAAGGGAARVAAATR